MQSNRARLDRFVSKKTGISRRDVRLLVAQGRLLVDGKKACAINQPVEQFTHVTLDQQVLQSQTPAYVMLNKPKGVVSATSDTRHSTVIDLLHREDREQLHIVGRLDFNSSGLMLLTNDGRWSRQLTMPECKVNKVYRVALKKPLTNDYIDTFAEGMYFSYEGITTRPAGLTILSDYVAEVSLTEGRYHQIKRMFGRFRNPVVELHRVSIGGIYLDESLQPGASRELTPEEVQIGLVNSQAKFA